jgi:hypothetical protein
MPVNHNATGLRWAMGRVLLLEIYAWEEGWVNSWEVGMGVVGSVPQRRKNGD